MCKFQIIKYVHKSNFFTASQNKPSFEDTCGVILERVGYYTIPPLGSLKNYKNDNGRCIVRGLTIGRVGYGNIYFPDEIDITDMNLDEIVHFEFRAVTVYPDDNKRPPVGQGLNRPAQVTLDNVFPRDDHDKEITDVTDIIKRNFTEKLKKMCESNNSKFKDYRIDTGSWVFTVEHFSKYGYIDDEHDKVKEQEQKDAAKKREHELKELTKKKEQELRDSNRIFKPIQKKDIGGSDSQIATSAFQQYAMQSGYSGLQSGVSGVEYDLYSQPGSSGLQPDVHRTQLQQCTSVSTNGEVF